MSDLDYNALKDLGVTVKGRELFRTVAPMYVHDNGDGTYDIKGVFVRRASQKKPSSRPWRNWPTPSPTTERVLFSLHGSCTGICFLGAVLCADGGGHPGVFRSN